MFRPFTLMRTSSGQTQVVKRGVYQVTYSCRYRQELLKNRDLLSFIELVQEYNLVSSINLKTWDVLTCSLVYGSFTTDERGIMVEWQIVGWNRSTGRRRHQIHWTFIGQELYLVTVELTRRSTPNGRYTLVTLPRNVTPYRDRVDSTCDHVTYQKLVTL